MTNLLSYFIYICSKPCQDKLAIMKTRFPNTWVWAQALRSISFITHILDWASWTWIFKLPSNLKISVHWHDNQCFRFCSNAEFWLLSEEYSNNEIYIKTPKSKKKKNLPLVPQISNLQYRSWARHYCSDSQSKFNYLQLSQNVDHWFSSELGANQRLCLLTDIFFYTTLNLNITPHPQFYNYKPISWSVIMKNF